MKLLGFLVKKRLLLFVCEPGRIGITLLKIFFLGITILYAFGFAALLGLPAFSATQKTVLTDSTLAAACAAIFVRRFLPVNIPAVPIIPAWMPLSRFKRISIGVIYEGLNSLFLYAFLFYGILFALTRPAATTIAATVILLLLANLAEIAIKSALAQQAARNLAGPASAKTRSSTTLAALFRLIAFRKASIRISLLVAYIFKALLLTVFALAMQKKPSLRSGLSENTIINAMFFAPTAVFTYLFNNLWGFMRAAWQSLAFGGDFRRLTRTWLQLAILSLLPDLFISFVFVFFARLPIGYYAALYLAQTILLLPLGLFFSTTAPFLVIKAISFTSMKPNTSFAGSLLVIAVVIGIKVLFEFLHPPLLALGVSTLASGLFWWLATSTRKRDLRTTYSRLT